MPKLISFSTVMQLMMQVIGLQIGILSSQHGFGENDAFLADLLQIECLMSNFSRLCHKLLYRFV